MQINETGITLIWLGVIYFMLLCGGLTYYLVRSWSKGSITLVYRWGAKDASLEANPSLFWFTFCLYLLLDVISLVVLLLGLKKAFAW